MNLKAEKTVTNRRTKTLQILRDDFANSPREWDNLGTMACWHNRYNLGDVQPSEDPQQFEVSLIEGKGGEGKNFNKHFISLPLYLYDHSGITMSTEPFSCPWDSGQVGFIYVSRSGAEREYNRDGKSFPQIRNTAMGDREFASLEDLVHHYLRGEVEVYDLYLQGEVYGFILVDENGEEEDSCWGFFGNNWRTNGIADYVDLSEVKEVHFMEERTHTRTVLEPVEIEELA